MNRSLIVAALNLCLLLSGCAFSSDKSEFADTPYIEKMGPGLIRYRNEGASFTKIARREDVHKKLNEVCNGQSHILREGEMSASGAIISINNPDGYSNAPYIYIKYECFP